MKFKMIHENYNVSDLDRSIKFYNEALDLHEVRRKTTDDFIIVYLSNDVSDFELELRGDATAEVGADRVCLVRYYRHRLVDRKDLAHLRSGDSGLGSGSDSGCYFFGIIRLVYDRHKMVVARE